MDSIIEDLISDGEKARKQDFEVEAGYEHYFALKAQVDLLRALQEERKQLLKSVNEIRSDLSSLRDEINRVHYGDGKTEPGLFKRLQYYNARLSNFGTDAVIDLDRRLREKVEATIDRVIDEKLALLKEKMGAL